MTVNELAVRCGFTPISVTDGDREVIGAYCGDLLSWVMGRAKQDSAWITIMTNVNVAAVASLSDVACVIIAESAKPDEKLTAAAADKGINILSSDRTVYETALAVGNVI